MGKFFKWLFITLGILLLLLIIGIVIILFIISGEKQKVNRNYTNVQTIENIFGDDLETSLKNIKNSDYKSVNNRISVDISQDEMNYFIYTFVIENAYNKHPNDKTYILGSNEAKITELEILFTDDNKVNVEAGAKLLGFYNTIANIYANPKIITDTNGNKRLAFEVENVKMGQKLNVPDFLTGLILDRFEMSGDIAFGKVDGKYVLSLDLAKVLFPNISNTLLKEILNKGTYNVYVKNKKLVFDISTSNIFGKPTEDIPAVTTAQKTALAAKFLAATVTHKVNLNNTEFNALIDSSLKKTLDEKKGNFKVGTKTFTYDFQNCYFYIDGTLLKGVMFINDTSIPFEVDFEVTVEKNTSNKFSALSLAVKSVKINELTLDEPKGLFGSQSIRLTKNDFGLAAFSLSDITDIQITNNGVTITFQEA
ncbi:MAG: hypothetical protein IJU60_06590 [Acholeplasmatales bacterium]|nr:hypothetical protein [Acholeplasmatales bacterium]